MPLNARDHSSGWRLLVLALILGFATHWTLALDPSTPLGQYRARTWKQRDGLPQNSAVALAQDGEGYLWVATFGGLARFNGREFRSFMSNANEGMPSDRIISLLDEPGGTLWIGTEKKGAASFKGGGFRPIPPFEGLQESSVIAIVQGAPGQHFLGTTIGLFELRDGAPVRRWSEKDGLPPREVPALLYQRSGDLWIGTTDGVRRLRKGLLERLPGEIPPGTIVYSLLKRRDGRLWIGSSKGVFTVGRDGFARHVSIADPEPAGDILRLFEDRDGSLWIGYRGGGLCRIAGGRAERYTTADGLPSDTVLALFEDREGSIWVGTDGEGLHQLTDSRIVAYGSPRISLGVPAACVAEDGSGGYWIGTRGAPFRGLVHLRDGKLDFLADSNFAWSPGILSIHRGERGTLWLGCEELGLYLLKSGVLSSGPALPFSSRNVRSFARKEGGGLLAGTSDGLFEIDSEEAAPRKVAGTEGLEVQSILLSESTTWLGTTSGLYSLSPAGLKKWDRNNGLPSDNVRALHIDAGGALWIGTYGGGLIRFAGGKLFHFGPESGLLAGTISFLAEDPQGRLWMTDNNGIFAVPRRQLDDLARGAASPLEVTHLTEEDGMIVRECNGGSQPAGILTSGGDLVACTINGIAVVHTDKSYPNPLPPPILIEGLRVGGKEVPHDGAIRLPPSARDIEIRYAALSFRDAGRVRYKVRLDGSDPDWIDLRNRAEAHYTELPPGSYRFRVIAANAWGVWNEEGASLDFRVLPRFYQTWWFLSLCGAAAVFSVVTMFRLRTAVLRRRGLELEAVVAARTEELREARDGLEVKVEERTADLVSAQAALKGQLAETSAAREALAESEERFRSLYENALLGIFRITMDGKLLLANPALRAMLGAKSESDLEGVNLCCGICVLGKSRGSCFHDLRKTDVSNIHEAEWTRLDGESIFVKIHAAVTGEGRGEESYIEGTVEDITTVKEVQKRLQVLETAIGAMDLGLTITDLSGNILYANQSEARMHGFSVVQLLERNAREMAPDSLRHELDWERTKERWIYRRECLNLRRDGTLFPVYLTSIPVTDRSGAPFCLVTLCEDRTEAKERESQLQDALREAVVGRLAAVVAHQVNTPLAAMKTRLDLLREDAEGNEETIRGIEILMKQVDKVAQTVRALLGFVRQRSIGGGKTPLHDIITSVAGLYETVFQSKGIRLEISLPEPSILVQGSAADLQEVFLNLFENHREALGRGNQVKIAARPFGGEVLITVEDDGPGLGEDPEKAFEPFYTTKVTGTGLGLAICRNICVASGGSIRGENGPPEAGGGARFVITLPISAQDNPKEETP